MSEGHAPGEGGGLVYLPPPRIVRSETWSKSHWRWLSVAALLGLSFLPDADRTYALREMAHCILLGVWLVAVLASGITRARGVRPSVVDAVFAILNGAFAVALSFVPSAPSALVGAGCAIASISAYDANIPRGSRVGAVVLVALLALLGRVLVGQSLASFGFVLLAIAVIAVGASRLTREDAVPMAQPAAAPAPRGDLKRTGQSRRTAAGGLQQRVVHAESLLRIRCASEGVQSPTDAASRIGRLLCSTYGFEAASAWLLSPGGEHLDLLGGYHLSRRAGRIATDQHLIGKVAVTGATSVTGSPTDGARDPAVAERGSDLGAQFLFPLSDEGRVRGVLALHGRRQGDPPPRAIPRELQEGVRHASAALADVVVLGREETGRRQMKALYDIACTFEAGRPTSELLSEVLEVLSRVVEFTNASVFSVQRRTGKLRLRASYGAHVDLREEVAFERGSGVSAWVAERQRSLVVPDVRLDPRWGTLPESVRSFACFPLVGEAGEGTGVLNLSADQPGRFGREEEGLLRIVASQSALTLRRAELYSSLETLALLDPATGLHNERFLPIALEREIAAVKGLEKAQFALVLLQPRELQAGRTREKRIFRLAYAARELIGPNGVICRYESDRLAMLLPGRGPRETRELLARLAEGLGPVGIVTGCSYCPSEGVAADAVLGLAGVRLGAALADRPEGQAGP